MSIKREDIERFSKEYHRNPVNKILENAITNNGLEKTCLNREVIIENQPIFNIELPESKRFDQENSSKCWIYAGLNMIKKNVADNLKIEVTKIALSDNYLAFFDKLEKSNNFYETIIQLEKADYENLDQLDLWKDAVTEGGYWEWFSALVNKYGLLPLSYMPNTVSSMNSKALEELYMEKVKKDAIEIIQLKEKKVSKKEMEKCKERYLQENYQFLAKILGEPPCSIHYEYKDKEGKIQTISNLTPIAFKEKYLTLSLEDFVVIGNVPMYNKQYGKMYQEKYLESIYGESAVKFLNLPIKELKSFVIKQLKEGIPVWMAGHVLKARDIKSGVLDTRLYNYEQTMGLKRLTKEEALNTRDISLHHAMTFIGVHLKDGKPQRWKVEDSYGDKNKVEGCYIMNDNFFEEFVLEVVIHKKYLNKKQLEMLKQKPIAFSIDDPI